MDSSLIAWIESVFPALAGTAYSITSSRDRRYNCIAWAAGEETRWWWPGQAPHAYWPEGAPNETSIEAFVRAYGTSGYARCSDGSPEAGVEKIAIFAGDDGVPTHAARQLEDGSWTSKLGGSVDLTHSLESLEGHEYGRVVAIVSRRRK